MMAPLFAGEAKSVLTQFPFWLGGQN